MRRKLFVTLTMLCATITLGGCSILGTVERVEPITDVNTSYHNQLNPTPVVSEDTVIMADETIPLEFDGPTWTELRVKYGLSVPVTETTTVERPLPPEPVEQLDKSGMLETMAIEYPMDADDGNKYILLKGQWYLFDEEDGVKAYVNNKCGALNFREGPSVGNKIYTSYRTKTEIKIYKAAHMSDNSTWYYVKQANGDMGWQHSYYINILETEKVKPATTDILDLMKPTESIEVTTIVNHDASGRLWTKKYTEVGQNYLLDGYTIEAPTRLWCYSGAGYTNDRIMAVEEGTELQVLGKAEMSNGLTWYRVKWQVEVEVVDTEETEHLERVDEETSETKAETSEEETAVIPEETDEPIINTPDVNNVTTVPSWNKLFAEEDNENDRNVIVNELKEEVGLTWPNAKYNGELTTASDADIWVLLEAETEHVTNGADLRAYWYNKLASCVSAEEVEAYNVYWERKYSEDLKVDQTKVYLVYDLVDADPIDNTEQAGTDVETPTETAKPEDEEVKMITVIKEYIGYIDYNVEKLLTEEEILDMYGVAPTATPTPTAKLTPTPKPTTKPVKVTPTPKPTIKLTPTPKPTKAPTPTIVAKPTPTVTFAPTVTPIPSDMAAVPISSNELTNNNTSLKLEAVKKLFKNAGFTNVQAEPKMYDTEIGQPEGLVYQVSVAGRTYYNKNDVFYEDAKVIIRYYTRKPELIITPSPSPTATPRPTATPTPRPTLTPMPTPKAGEVAAPFDSSIVDAGFNLFDDSDFIWKELYDAGFYNIEYEEVYYDPAVGQPEGLIKQIKIGRDTSFRKGQIYYKDVQVIIYYYTHYKAKPTATPTPTTAPISSSQCRSPYNSSVFTNNTTTLYVEGVAATYKAAGFTNVSVYADPYNPIVGQPQGMVKNVSIAGSTSFTQDSKFFKDASVVITYYTRIYTSQSSEEMLTLSLDELLTALTNAGFAGSIYAGEVDEDRKVTSLDDLPGVDLHRLTIRTIDSFNDNKVTNYTSWSEKTAWPTGTVVIIN